MRKVLYLALAFLAGSLLATALVNAAPIHDSFEAYLPTPYRFEVPGGEIRLMPERISPGHGP